MAVISGDDADSRAAGSNGADRIHGAGDGDVLFRRDGSDRVFGGGGADAIQCDNGGATLIGGPRSAVSPMESAISQGAVGIAGPAAEVMPAPPAAPGPDPRAIRALSTIAAPAPDDIVRV